jgi:hypothetical protein
LPSIFDPLAAADSRVRHRDQLIFHDIFHGFGA